LLTSFIQIAQVNYRRYTMCNSLLATSKTEQLPSSYRIYIWLQ
jgi:hypothetical protein